MAIRTQTTMVTRSGSELYVNTQTEGDQRQPDVAAFADGGFAVTWVDEMPSTDIRLQRYGDSGMRVSTEVLVNQQTSNFQNDPSICALKGGGYAVVWWDNSGLTGDTSEAGIVAQLFDAGGDRQTGTILINAQKRGWQGAPFIAGLEDGGFVVVWREENVAGGDGSGSSVKARLFDSAGKSRVGELMVNTQTVGHQSGTSVSALEGGGFVVVWVDEMTFPESEVRAQVFAGDGSRLGGEIDVNSLSKGMQFGARVAPLADGGFVIVWDSRILQDNGPEPEYLGVKAQRFDAAGNKLGDEFLVGDQSGPGHTAVASLDGGSGFVASWVGKSGSGAEPNIMVQVFDASGERCGPEIAIDAPASAIGGIDISALHDGGFVLAWSGQNDALSDVWGVRAQLFALVMNETFDLRGTPGDTAAGGPGTDIYLVDDPQDRVDEVADHGTDTVRTTISWTLADNLEVLELGGNATIDGAGNALANLVQGNSAANALSGLGGNDTLRGGDGADTLAGGAGVDALSGGGGDDLYIVQGADLMVESTGAGKDTVESSMSWTLANNFESLLLKGAGAINGTGNDGPNNLTGNDGANRLTGGGGGDTLVGGLGADTLRGDAGADQLTGGGGNDSLIGGAGSDTLNGGAGADVFVFDVAPAAAGNLDRVPVFTRGEDVFQLSSAVFTAFAGSTTVGAAQFVKGAGLASAQDADDRLVYDTSTGALYYDPDGVGGQAAVKFALVGASTHPALSAGDFVVSG